MTRDEAQVGVRVRFIDKSPAHAGLTGVIVKTGLDTGPHGDLHMPVVDLEES